MKQFDTVIFDMDGTILDTAEDLMDSLNFALRQSGCSERSLLEVKSYLGNGGRKLVERAAPQDFTEEERESCLACFKEHYNQNMANKTKPYEGIISLLRVLLEQGYKTAVISNKYDTAVKELAADYFGDLFMVAIGEGPDTKEKPAPDGVNKALFLLKSKKEHSIFVGDSQVDIMTAKNAGLKSIGVTWGFRNREVLEAEGADYIVDEPASILALLS